MKLGLGGIILIIIVLERLQETILLIGLKKFLMKNLNYHYLDSRLILYCSVASVFVKYVSYRRIYIFFLFFIFIWVLRPFQEYFTYIEPIVHQRWAKTGEPGEKPPDHL